ncbi:MAG: hypothetical protein M9962_03645 [Oligoflexia bacterium]|nr:hypothetical protein [Oligoflexia bacterium]
MKRFAFLILGIAILAWPIGMRNILIPTVYADTGTSSVTVTGTQTTTGTETFTSNPSTETVNDNQNTTQQDTEDLNDSGSQQSTMLGMMAIAAGAAMVAAGMACAPAPCVGLIMAGMALIAAGMMGLMAAGMMGNNANTAGYRSGNMSGITGSTATNTATGTGTNPGESGGIKIDPNLLRTGQSGTVFDDLESKTGINRDDFVNAIGNGADPASMLANAPKLKGLGVSEDALKGYLSDAQSSSLPGADDIMSKLGLTPEELEAMAKQNAAFNATGEDNSYGAGGGSRNPASNKSASSNPDINSFLNANKDLGASVDKLGKDGMGLSPEVQAALDRNGITGQTIFQMVHTQYKKKTPMMFGVQQKKTISTSENPFLNLSGNDVNL